jgi:heme ABC exporter ATP-binding subunit CcmA
MRLPSVDPIVDFRSIGVSLGGHPVLRGVNLTLAPGEVLGVSGPNGSGKTTLIRTIATLTSIDSGSGTVLGTDLTSTSLVSTRRRIGMIGHHPALIPELTLTENLTHAARLAGIEVARVANALGVVGLEGASDRRADACSFGMRRRVEIAHLLLTRPTLLLLDEAASGLDSSARDLISAVVDSTRSRGGGTVVVSHDESQLRGITQNVMSLSGGRLEPSR